MKTIVEKLQGRSVLIVEDHVELGSILRRLIATRGMRACIVNSGNRALQELKCETYDIILLDLYLRDMNGLDIVTLVRQNEKTKHIPVVAITAALEKKQECIRRGCDDFLLKPFDTTELMSCISALVH